MPDPSLPDVAVAFVARGYAEARAHRLSALLSALGMLCGMLSFYFLARFVGGGVTVPHRGGYFAFALVGMLGVDLFASTLATCGRRVREAQVSGTLDGLLATPTPETWVIALLPAWDICASLLRVALYVAAGALLFGVPMRIAPLSLSLALALTLAAVVPLGLLGAAVTMTLRRPDPLALFLGMASSLLGGVLYPVDALPSWARAAAQALPLTHALEALRGALLAGASPAALARPLAMLALLAAVLVPSCGAAFLFALRRARVDGSLTSY
ncbi:MAG: ABC transporter permease [Myxococcota bacterium]